MFASFDLNTNFANKMYSHLPPKKRITRDIAPYSQAGLVLNLSKPQILPTSIPDASSLSPCSTVTSETYSIDSGFVDVEPLDLTFNPSIVPSPAKVTDDISACTPTSSMKPSLTCPECDKVYESNSRFRAHLRRHESKQSGRYRCTVCSKNFVQRSSLKTHERIHTGEKPYHCLLCDERFGDFSTFTKHRRTHTGEKPYSCPVCARSFSQSGNMHRHLKVVHKPHLDLYRQWCDDTKCHLK